jgi:cytosine/adenosine deaminase-related metal-dependent hydrolase
VRLEEARESGLRNHYPSMVKSGCTLYVAYSRLYHEEFASRAVNATSPLGIRIVALTLK